MSSYSIRATAILPLNSQPLSGQPLSGLPLLPIPTNPSSQQSQGWLPRFVFLRPNDTDKTTTLTIREGLPKADGGPVTVLGVNITTRARAIKQLSSWHW